MNGTKILSYILLCPLMFFIQCKKDKNTDPTGTPPTKLNKIIVTGADPQEYYFEYSGNSLTRVTAYGLGDYDITEKYVCEYAYGSDGKIQSIRYTYNDGSDDIKYFFYDTEGRLSRVENGSGEYPFLNKYFYNVNGANIYCTYYYSYNKNAYQMLDSIVYSSLNSFAKPALKTYYSLSYINDVPYLSNHKVRYTYDSKGNLIKEESYDSTEDLWNTSSEYEYAKEAHYPDVFGKFAQFLDGESIDIFSPSENYLDKIPSRSIYHLKCNSIWHQYEDAYRIELNRWGNISRQFGTDEDLGFNDCIKTSNDIDIRYYYE